MAVVGAVVTVTTAATLLSGADTDNVAGQCLFIQVPAAGQAVELGGSGVTFGTGYSVATGSTFGPIKLGVGESLYGIVTATTQPVRVLRTGV